MRLAVVVAEAEDEVVGNEENIVELSLHSTVRQLVAGEQHRPCYCLLYCISLHFHHRLKGTFVSILCCLLFVF